MTGEVTPTDSSAPLPPEPPTPELPALPGLAAEEAAGHGRADRFRTWVAIAIALVSILGAVVAFSGTLAEQEARHLDQQGIQDAAASSGVGSHLAGAHTAGTDSAPLGARVHGRSRFTAGARGSHHATRRFPR